MFSKGTKKEVAVIVQARMGSTRLAGKVLMELMDGNTVLGFFLKRLSECKRLDKVIVATTTNSKDDILEKWLVDNNYSFFRGSEDNCIQRYQEAAKKFDVDIIVRVTSDCPLVVPEVIDEMVKYYLDHSQSIDYLSNRQFTNFPEGLDVEIFTFKMLTEARKNAALKEEFEHINNFFLNRPSEYRIRYYNHNKGSDYSRFKLSVDTLEDLDGLRGLFSKRHLAEDFSFDELIERLNSER